MRLSVRAATEPNPGASPFPAVFDPRDVSRKGSLSYSEKQASAVTSASISVKYGRSASGIAGATGGADDGDAAA